MQKPLNLVDLFIRIFVIALTSLVLIIATSSNSFDLHLKIRKAQSTSEKVVILELSPKEDIEKAIRILKEKSAEKILLNSFLGDTKAPLVYAYTSSDPTEATLFIQFKPDFDGQIRRFLIEKSPLSEDLFPALDFGKNTLINIRGPSQTFEHLSYYDLQHIPIKGKTVIIKSTSPINSYTTPLGVITEAELVANVMDNYYESRFVPYAPWLTQVTIAMILLVITLILLLLLPSTLALMGTIILAISYLSLSLWMFDNFYIWTPLVSPIVQIVLTFLLISNYKYILNEKTKWNLEKESKYFDEVEEMKTNFLSLFSHDLKTPLSKIIGITDTLMSKYKDSEIKTELEKINTYSRDLDKYIKRILKMSQVQSKNISLIKAPEDVNEIIEKSIQQNKLVASEKNIVIEKDLKPLFMIEIDATLIQEVVINFLENAITYSPNDSKIIVKSTESNNFIKVSVIDQGAGIPKEAQESIWEKYYRFDSSKPGYGLGLFLSRYVINLHGGQVFLKSKVGQGSEFGFILPVSEETDESND